jgi:hypothetical protein
MLISLTFAAPKDEAYNILRQIIVGNSKDVVHLREHHFLQAMSTFSGCNKA